MSPGCRALLTRVRAHPNLVAALVLMAAAIVYVALALSPSSYGAALRLVGAPEAGPVVGEPRGIRSDEWAVMTPFTQALVRSGFQRYNVTSFYEEDFRSFYTLPIFDWGLLFKPTVWGYVFLPPAHAYSLHYAACTLLLVVGLSLLLQRLGVETLAAWLLALLFFFSAATQFWWTSHAAPPSLFPWVMLSALVPRAPAVRWWAFFYACAALLFEFFYPPFVIAFSFVGVVLLVAFARASLTPRNVALLGSAAAVALIAALVYFTDYLAALGRTVYPGQRVMHGGLLGPSSLASVFLPFVGLDGYRSLIDKDWAGADICRSAVVGTYYFLLVICLLDYRTLRQSLFDPRHRPWLIALGGALLAGIWMFIPVPSWAGVPLLWHRVPSQRLALGAGILCLLAAHVAAVRVGLRMTPPRVIAFAALIVVPAWLMKHVGGGVPVRSLGLDLSIVALICLPLFVGRLALPSVLPLYVLLASLAVNVAGFAPFNPIQSARPIFDPPETRFLQNLRQEALLQGDKPLLNRRLPGAVANGLGFRSVQHVTHLPTLDVWKEVFPDLPPARLDGLFNRYLHVLITDEAAPRLLQADAVYVPLDALLRRADAQRSCVSTPGGHVDRLTIEANRLRLDGWAPWRGNFYTQRLFAHPLPPGSTMSLRASARPDVAKALRRESYTNSGFTLEVTLPPGADAASAASRLCLVAVDRDTNKRVRIVNRFAPGACEEVCGE